MLKKCENFHQYDRKPSIERSDRTKQEKARSYLNEKSQCLMIPGGTSGSIFYIDGPPSDPLIPICCMQETQIQKAQCNKTANTTA